MRNSDLSCVVAQYNIQLIFILLINLKSSHVLEHKCKMLELFRNIKHEISTSIYNNPLRRKIYLFCFIILINTLQTKQITPTTDHQFKNPAIPNNFCLFLQTDVKTNHMQIFLATCLYECLCYLSKICLLSNQLSGIIVK